MRICKSVIAFFILSLLLVSSSQIIPCSVKGASSTQLTILYFTPYNATNIDEIEDLKGVELSTQRPVDTDYSIWPPPLLNKDGVIPKVNSEAWLSWFQMWLIFKFFYEMPEMEEFTQSAELRSIIDIFNPFKVRENYVYTGNKTVEINDKIIFDLYFSSESTLRHKDTVKVSLSKSMLFLSEELINTTITIEPTLIKGRIKQYQVILDCTDKHIEVNPGDTLTLSVEIIPSERAISKVMNWLSEKGFEEKLLKRAERLSVFLSNRRNQKLQDLGATIQDLLNITDELSKEGVNLTLADLGDLADGLHSSSFIFASSKYPSRVTLPLVTQLAGESKIITYYLSTIDSNHVLTEDAPTADEPSEEKISESPVKWITTPLERNKIIKLGNVTATLYFDYRNMLNIRKINLTVKLQDEDKTIAASSLILKRRGLLSFIKEKVAVITINFEDMDYEIFNGRRLGLSISLSNNTNIGFRKINLLTDSKDTPSSLRVHYEETDNIKIKADNNISKILPGGSAVYTLNITSKYADKIRLTTTNTKKNGDWIVAVKPDELNMKDNDYKLVKVYVNSTDQTKRAYGSDISFKIDATGKTGRATMILSTTVSKDAARYDVDIVNYSKSKDIKKGENDTLSFRIRNNNTGAIDEDDSYRVIVSSANGWNLQYDTTISKLGIGAEKTVRVKVFVPSDTNLEYDELTFTIISNTNEQAKESVNVKVKVISGGVFEGVYNLFLSLSNEIGLGGLLGEYAPITLAVTILILIFIVIIVIILILKRKLVVVNCSSLIKDIKPGEEAVYPITIKNPTSRTRVYDISLEGGNTDKWSASLNKEHVQLQPQQSEIVNITVKPLFSAVNEDWVETKVKIKTDNKLIKEFSTITTLHDTEKMNLRIKNVTHTPSEFKPKERVVTSFIIENNKPTAVKDVTATLYINEKERSKVSNITIPGYGYAEVSIPWIAEKGRNDVKITLNTSK